jgi:hypothetical protein
MLASPSTVVAPIPRPIATPRTMTAYAGMTLEPFARAFLRRDMPQIKRRIPKKEKIIMAAAEPNEIPKPTLTNSLIDGDFILIITR